MIGPNHLPPNIFQHAPKSTTAGRKGFDREALKRLELIEALEEAEGNQSRAAELLGVTRVTVWNRMRRYGVQYKKTIAADAGEPRPKAAGER
jgi:transcriptional regulator of acetoin/glycerol metabolism